MPLSLNRNMKETIEDQLARLKRMMETPPKKDDVEEVEKLKRIFGIKD